MKKIFSIFALALLFAACSNNAKEEARIKQQAIVAVRDSLKLDSFRRAEVQQKAALAKANEEKIKAEQIREQKRILLLSERNEAAAARNSAHAEAAPVQNKKKGWSQAAKGTLIGAGAGAIGGALIDKRSGRGAIIGGVLGAGTGYLIGRGQDRKSGRVQPKN